MKKLLILFLIVLLTGCVTAQPKDYSKFNAANPKSILIIPVVNRTVEVTAADYMLSTITVPLAECGYYVFPVNMVKRILEDDGLSDSSLVHQAPVARLADLFGADAVLYVTIDEWDSKYLVLSTQVTVGLSYQIKDAKTGDTLWDHSEKMVYTPQSSGGGNPLGTLIVMAVNAAITKAAPNYMPLARQANAKAFTYPGPGIPPGPYLIAEGAKK